MATLQDVQNSLTAHDAAAAAESQAQASFAAVEAVVEGALATERATFDAAQAVWFTALNAARDAAGWPAALAARDAANVARLTAESDAKQVMSDFVNGV